MKISASGGGTELLLQSFRNIEQRFAPRRIGRAHCHRHPAVAAHSNLREQRDFTEKRYVLTIGFRTPAAVAKK